KASAYGVTLSALMYPETPPLQYWSNHRPRLSRLRSFHSVKKLALFSSGFLAMWLIEIPHLGLRCRGNRSRVGSCSFLSLRDPINSPDHGRVSHHDTMSCVRAASPAHR